MILGVVGAGTMGAGIAQLGCAAGMRTVLRLRSKFGSPRKTLTDPLKYVDLSYYEKALGKP